VGKCPLPTLEIGIKNQIFPEKTEVGISNLKQRMSKRESEAPNEQKLTFTMLKFLLLFTSILFMKNINEVIVETGYVSVTFSTK